MPFKDLKINENYDSKKDDIYDDFFIPVISKSNACKRFGGKFCLNDLLKISEGMKEFIQNHGYLQLILFSNFSDDDIQSLNSGLKNEEQIIIDSWNYDYENNSDNIISEHVKALSWMMNNQLLEIKLISFKDESGKYIKLDKTSHMSILKEKDGIFVGNENDDIICFSGSLDYDEKYDESNFSTFRYWMSDQREKCDEIYSKFQRLWDGEEKNHFLGLEWCISELPEKIKEKFLEDAPNSIDDVNFQRPFSLRKIQQTAIDNWKANRFHGIYEMATGTGKTRTAIGSIKELEKVEKFFSIIIVPTDPLGIQWKNELEKWGFHTKITMGNSKWRIELEDGLRLFNSNKFHNLCIVTSYVTYAKEEFQNIIKTNKSKKLIIADEMHHAGSEYSQNGLMEDYDYRLGLTATLERYFDEEGTKMISDFFGGVVFTYDMDEAIKDGYLCKYNYHIRQVDLTDDEYVNYRKETLTMAKNFSSIKRDPEAFEKYKRAAERRANIVKSAFNKYHELKKIIQEGNNVKYGLIYCNFDQIDKVQRILDNNKPNTIFSRQITVKKTPQRKDKEEIFEGLVDDLYDVILAINILDEGWDCPEIKNCILMANTGNEKQYVQRRGRVLRPNNKTYSDGSKKEYADVYDMCVLPEINSEDEDVKRMEKRLIEKELNRMQIMANSAKNDECRDFLNEYRERVGLT